jgi:hypothetical protein
MAHISSRDTELQERWGHLGLSSITALRLGQVLLCQRRAGTVRHQRGCATLKNRASYLQKSQFTFRSCRRKCAHNTLGRARDVGQPGPHSLGETRPYIQPRGNFRLHLSDRQAQASRFQSLKHTRGIWNPVRLNGTTANPGS